MTTDHPGKKWVAIGEIACAIAISSRNYSCVLGGSSGAAFRRKVRPFGGGVRTAEERRLR